MKKYLLIFCILSFPAYLKEANASQKCCEVLFECKTADGNLNNLHAFCFELNNDQKTLINEIKNPTRFKFIFDCNKDYLISFEKNGYVNKTISVNTKNIAQERLNKEFAKLKCAITLTAQPNDSIVEYTQPVAAIYYSEKDDDFIFQPTYAHTAKSK